MLGLPLLQLLVHQPALVRPPACLSLRHDVCTDGRACCSTVAACDASPGVPWCAGAPERPPVYVTTNPLRGLPALPKPHYSWPLPGLFMKDVTHADSVLVVGSALKIAIDEP